ncbi:MAG: hypothetical protein WA989_15910 [Henriciella sp.]|uniref:hypothetical protein n=1 Tax=Henriciella sp. TaxID=1968823 RepID=UPI003C7645DA
MWTPTRLLSLGLGAAFLIGAGVWGAARIGNDPIEACLDAGGRWDSAQKSCMPVEAGWSRSNRAVQQPVRIQSQECSDLDDLVEYYRGCQRALAKDTLETNCWVLPRPESAKVPRSSAKARDLAEDALNEISATCVRRRKPASSRVVVPDGLMYPRENTRNSEH